MPKREALLEDLQMAYHEKELDKLRTNFEIYDEKEGFFGTDGYIRLKVLLDHFLSEIVSLEEKYILFSSQSETTGIFNNFYLEESL
jgi:hypothetical protein